MTYPTIIRNALVAVQNSSATMSAAVFGLKSGTTVLEAVGDGSDGVIGGIGSTAATAMMLLT
jgi:hypothetical protein